MKKRNLLNIFNNKAVLNSETNLESDFNILESYIPQIFPTPSKDSNNTNFYNKINKILNSAKIAYSDEPFSFLIYDENILPLHTRDEKWLTKYLMHIIKEQNYNNKSIQRGISITNKKFKELYPLAINEPKLKKDISIIQLKHELSNIKPNTVKEFIKNNKKFDDERNRYEIDLVRAQIRNFINIYNNNDNVHNNFKNDHDEYFYNFIVKTMSKLGIAKHSIETGLELDSSLWRKPLMIDAFNTQIEKFNTQTYTHSYHTWLNEQKLIDDLREQWIVYKEYIYYQKHKNIIDELNFATPNMKLSGQTIKEKMNLLSNYITISKEDILQVNYNIAQEENNKTQTI